MFKILVILFLIYQYTIADVSHLLHTNEDRHYLPPEPPKHIQTPKVEDKGFSTDALKQHSYQHGLSSKSDPKLTTNYKHSKPKGLTDLEAAPIDRLHTAPSELSIDTDRRNSFTPGNTDIYYGSKRLVYANAPHSVFHTQINVQSQESDFKVANNQEYDTASNTRSYAEVQGVDRNGHSLLDKKKQSYNDKEPSHDKAALRINFGDKHEEKSNDYNHKVQVPTYQSNEKKPQKVDHYREEKQYQQYDVYQDHDYKTPNHKQDQKPQQQYDSYQAQDYGKQSHKYDEKSHQQYDAYKDRDYKPNYHRVNDQHPHYHDQNQKQQGHHDVYQTHDNKQYHDDYPKSHHRQNEDTPHHHHSNSDHKANNKKQDHHRAQNHKSNRGEQYGVPNFFNDEPEQQNRKINYQGANIITNNRALQSLEPTFGGLPNNFEGNGQGRNVIEDALFGAGTTIQNYKTKGASADVIDQKKYQHVNPKPVVIYAPGEELTSTEVNTSTYSYADSNSSEEKRKEYNLRDDGYHYEKPQIEFVY